MSAAPLAAFADPVHEAQQTFRAALEALARPGTLHKACRPAEWPRALPAAALALALALADPETPIWIDGGGDCAIADYLRFHTGCPVIREPDRAVFALGRSSRLPELATFNQGTDRHPDGSTTVVMAVDSLRDGARLRLRGPGIETQRVIACAGLPHGFGAQWAHNGTQFPRGIDLFLVAGDEFIALPRTATIEEA